MTGYIIAAVVLIVDGLLFNAFALGGGEKLSSEVLTPFFYFSSGTTIIASVFISMRLFAEERQTGTLVLLTSSPVHDGEIVLGKFLSALVFLSLLTAGDGVHAAADLRERQDLARATWRPATSACSCSAARRWRSGRSGRRWRARRCWRRSSPAASWWR